MRKLMSGRNLCRGHSEHACSAAEMTVAASLIVFTAAADSPHKGS